jgi:glycosyltransferase involved in cell wall biosynthesis
MLAPDRSSASLAPGLTGKRGFVHVVASLNERVGGPARSVAQLVSQLAIDGYETKVVTLDYPELGPQADVSPAKLISIAAGPISRHVRGFSPRLRAELERMCDGKSTAILHSHGLWMFPNLYAGRAAIRSPAKHVVSPRGMLDAWSLGRGRIKKQLVWRAWQHKLLAQASGIHATSESEAESIRRIGLRAPIAIIPNGVELPHDFEASPELLTSRFEALRDKRWVLFLSRIHPKKGVKELLAAWKQTLDLARAHGFVLLVAGDSIDDYSALIQLEVERLGLADTVVMTGDLRGLLKRSAFINSDVFVLPTHSENFGIAIAESLAHGCPVITTKGAPWPQIPAVGCGWWIDQGLAPLVDALTAALSMPRTQLQGMGARGESYITKHFSWPSVTKSMSQFYSWLTDGGVVPSFVQL